MDVSAEVVHSLRILGLSSDATADEVRSAFRRLARAYHPDVAGRHYSRKFAEITQAYALLRELPQESFSRKKTQDATKSTKSTKSAPKNEEGRGFSFFGKPLAWYRKRRERIGAERERLRRAAEDAEKDAQKKILLENEARIDAALNRTERLLDDLLSRREAEMLRVGTQGLATRLASDNCQVRHLALAHLANLKEPANTPEIFEALLKLLQKWDIDEKTARMTTALPLSQENHRRLALGLAAKASAMPDSLISHLLQLYNTHSADRELLETYLKHAGASAVALILRRWPLGAFVSEPTLLRLLSHESESVLLSVFSAMKQRSVPCPEGGLARLNACLSHPSTAVRIWAKALLPADKISAWR